MKNAIPNAIPANTLCHDWLKTNGILTRYDPSALYCPWMAWHKGYDPEYMNDHYGCGFGQTELEAAISWCVSCGMYDVWYSPFKEQS